MNQLFTIFAKKVLKVSQGRNDETKEKAVDKIEGNFSTTNPSVEMINLCRIIIEDRTKRSPEQEVNRKSEFRLSASSLRHTTREIEYLEKTLQEQRAIFAALREELQEKQSCLETRRKSIEEDSKRMLPLLSKESCSKMLLVCSENDIQKKLLIEKKELFDVDLDLMSKRNSSLKMIMLQNRLAIQNKYSNLLAKYDCDIGALHKMKDALKTDRELQEQDLMALQERLNVQRVLYEGSKKEREFLIRQAILVKLQEFHQNRAAKIIQRTWRLYRERMTSKKKRGRK